MHAQNKMKNWDSVCKMEKEGQCLGNGGMLRESDICKSRDESLPASRFLLVIKNVSSSFLFEEHRCKSLPSLATGHPVSSSSHRLFPKKL